MYLKKTGVLIVVIFFILCSSSPELFLLFIIYIFLHLHYLITCGYTKLSLQLFENAHCFWSSCPSIARNFYSTGLVAGSSSLSCCLNPHCWFLNPQPSTNQHYFWADTIFHEQPKIVGTKKKNITQQDLFIINPHIYTIFVFFNGHGSKTRYPGDHPKRLHFPKKDRTAVNPFGMGF